MQQEVVEAEGHLIDSHLMERIFDTVVEYNGRFEVEDFSIGRTNVRTGSKADIDDCSYRRSSFSMCPRRRGPRVDVAA